VILPSLEDLRALVGYVLADKDEQGHEVSGLRAALDATPDSYDALVDFAVTLSELPMRADWPWVEPSTLEEIKAVASWPTSVTPAGDVSGRIETAFLARVSGCVLGKPFEFDPTLEELRGVLEPAGEWPLRDYVTTATNALLRAPQPQWPELVREQIRYVAEDDDINYTVIGMLLLEQHGLSFTAEDLRREWLLQLPVLATFGPERTQLLAAGLSSMLGSPRPPSADVLNPFDEHCGALIRADAYGYACPGNPALAASLAHRDAFFTHRRTGVYATMLVAAALSIALVSEPDDRLGPWEAALDVIPPASRLAWVVRDSLAEVAAATDWLDGYARLHGRYGAFSHCRVYQEIGTLLNTSRFARDVGEGIGMQVCQGNDTDSFGATAGSYLGALLGPSAFDREHWTARFNDDIHLALATCHIRSLSELARRMSRLPDAL
jgi:ADP-ribosylglycohydrolase